MALISAGNALESVAHVFGVSVDTLRGWVAQPVDSLPDEASRSTEPTRQWLRFPGTVVYRSGSNWALVAAAFAAMSIVALVVAWQVVFTGHGVAIAPSVLVAMAGFAATIQSIRAARANCFEMHPDSIARYTLSGCTVLPFADIVGLTSSIGKGIYCVNFLTRTGVSLTIHPTFLQLEDERLWTWLQAIPKRDGCSIQRPSEI